MFDEGGSDDNVVSSNSLVLCNIKKESCNMMEMNVTSL